MFHTAIQGSFSEHGFLNPPEQQPAGTAEGLHGSPAAGEPTLHNLSQQECLYQQHKHFTRSIRCPHKPFGSWVNPGVLIIIVPWELLCSKAPHLKHEPSLLLSCGKITSKRKDFWQLLPKDMLPWTCTLRDSLAKVYRAPCEFTFITLQSVVPLWSPKGSWEQEHLCSINWLSQSDPGQVVELVFAVVFVSVSPSVNMI